MTELSQLQSHHGNSAAVHSWYGPLFHRRHFDQAYNLAYDS